MLFRNSNIENIPVIKKLCDNIMDEFKKLLRETNVIRCAISYMIT